MKNFNIYDPMKRGQGLVLDGQTLAHVEVRINCNRSLWFIIDAIGNILLCFKVLLNNEGTEEGSLLKLLSRCITPFGMKLHVSLPYVESLNDIRVTSGKRLFRIWLCMPLREVSDINARLVSDSFPLELLVLTADEG